ncbi:hypothetical protein Y717_25785 [Streptomyces scopuliridis RB72]|uniref:Uncharacterized protein n=1 Tax=Streptomyces scopuliridis RB72 TaxID=1440053 RepID=A0A2T7SWG1_9ACTN|nr:hypothetical protein Y717_25785 [Streptomyces scopuliridis RB72]
MDSVMGSVMDSVMDEDSSRASAEFVGGRSPAAVGDAGLERRTVRCS